MKADSAWNEDSWTMAARADLTGDGKKEMIRLEPFFGKVKNSRSPEHYFRLTINGQKIYDATSSRVDGFSLVNINQQDRWKEIRIRVPFETGDWDGSLIYWFDGRKIRRVLSKPLIWLKFPGDGRVLHNEYVGAPVSPEMTYRLQPDHTLLLQKQKYYPVNANFTVKEPFPIYSRHSDQRIAMLRKGTKVRILKSDLGDWLYLRAGRSTYGWMNTRWNNSFAAFGVVAAG